jgi:hypothetical protein
MNYRIIFRDTLRLFGSSKLPWILGAFSFGSEFLYGVTVYSIGKQPVACIPYPLLLLAISFSFIAKTGLIFSTKQIASFQHITFSATWNFCTAKMKSLGLYFVSFPLLFVSVFTLQIFAWSKVTGLSGWFVGMQLIYFLISLLTMSMCTVVIHDLTARHALWTGFLIVVRNFPQLITLNSIYIVLHILVVGAIENAYFGFLVLVPFTVTITLAYQLFVEKVSYPALSNVQNTA